MYFCFLNREGTIQIGDEIVNVAGHSVRGISMQQIRDLLESAYNRKDQTDIDMVICRYGMFKPKLRKKSIDSYGSYLNDDHQTNGEYTEFASTALK